MLAYARRVVIVPGYGLAVAQAQHDVRELGELLEEQGRRRAVRDPPRRGAHAGPHERAARGGERPVRPSSSRWTRSTPSCRRPTSRSSIGANDVVNPAARNDPASPIYGMPILDVDKATNVVVIKRSPRPGLRRASTTRSSTTRRRRCSSATRRQAVEQLSPPSRTSERMVPFFSGAARRGRGPARDARTRPFGTRSWRTRAASGRCRRRCTSRTIRPATSARCRRSAVATRC